MGTSFNDLWPTKDKTQDKSAPVSKGVDFSDLYGGGDKIDTSKIPLPKPVSVSSTSVGVTPLKYSDYLATLNPDVSNRPVSELTNPESVNEYAGPNNPAGTVSGVNKTGIKRTISTAFKGIDEEVKKSGDAPLAVLKFMVSGITQPFIQGIKAEQNRADDPKNYSKISQWITTRGGDPNAPEARLEATRALGLFSPFDYEEARRGMIAASVATAATIVSGGAIAGALPSSMSTLARTGIGAAQGVMVGGAVQGALEKEESASDKIERMAAYTLISIPFALMTDFLSLGNMKGSSLYREGIIKKVKADAYTLKLARDISTPKGEPFTVKAFRGGDDPNAPSGTYNGNFYTDNPVEADTYAKQTPNGSVIEKELNFNNALIVNNWMEAKTKLGMSISTPMAELIKEAGNKGYDGIVFAKHRGMGRAIQQHFVEINKPMPSADDLAKTKAVRAFDESAGVVQIDEAPILSTTIDQQRDLVNAGRPGEAALLLRNYVSEASKATDELPIDPISPKQELISKEKLSSLDIAKNNLNEALITLHTIKSAKDSKVTTIIPGLTDAHEVIKAIATKLPRGTFHAIFKRPDGLMDIAIGNQESALKGKILQFQHEGYYEGQTVYVDGADYVYKGRHTDPKYTFVTQPGETVGMKVLTSDLRRAPDQTEVLAKDYKIDDVKEILDTDEEKRAYTDIIANGVEKTTEQKATSNHLKITRGPAGGYHVIDEYTGKVIGRGFKTQEEANAFVNQSNQAGGPPVIPPPPIDLGDTPNLIPGDDSNGPVTDMFLPKNGPIGRILTGMLDGLTKAFPFFHLTDLRFSSLDKQFKPLGLFKFFTDSQKDYSAFQSALNNKDDGWLMRLKKVDDIGKRGRFSLDDYKLVGEYIQTASADELAGKIGQVNLEYGEELYSLGPTVSTDNVYKFRRQRIADLDLIKQSEGREITGEDVKNVNEELKRIYQMNEAEMKAVELFDRISDHSGTDESVRLDLVNRYANAKWDGTMSQKDFAKFHKLSPFHLEYAKGMQALYDEAGEYLGVDKIDAYGYLHHAQARGLNLNLDGTTVERSGPFIGELYRTGEVGNYDLNPTTNFAKYIYNGLLRKEFLPKFNSDLSHITKRMEQLGIDQTNSRVAKQLEAYRNDLQGIPNSWMDASINDAVNTMIKHFPFMKDVSVDVLRDWVNPLTAGINSATQGFSIGAGVRDRIDGLSKYYYDWGVNRARRFIQLGHDSDAIALLKESGVIQGLDRYEFQTSDEAATGSLVRPARSTFRKLGKQFTEGSLKASLQPKFYEMAQAGAYLEMMETVSGKLKSLESKDAQLAIGKDGRINKSKYKVYDEVGVFKFDAPIISEFDRLISKEDYKGAADYLGRMNVYRLIGRYGMGNNAYGGRTIFGRLSLNLGTWSMQTKGFVQRGLTQGTKSNRLGFAARMAIGESAKFAVGNATGLNLRSWYILAGVPFASGPLAQLAYMGVAAQAGTNSDRDAFINRLTQIMPTDRYPRSIFIPGSFAFANWWLALNENNVDDPVKFLGRGMGIPVKPSNPLEVLPWGMVAGDVYDRVSKKVDKIIQ